MQQDVGKGVGLITLSLLQVLGIFNHVKVSDGQSTECATDAVAEACRRCDGEYGLHLHDLSGNFFGVSNTTGLSYVEVAQSHCSVAKNVSGCYTDCVQGTDYQVPGDALRLNRISSDLCNETDCYSYFVFGCYAENGAQLFSGFNVSTSGCNSTTNTLSESISKCWNSYTSQMRCNGVCTAGPRSLKWVKLAQEIACQISATSEVCSAEVQLCLTQTYGVLGDKFIVGKTITNATGDAVCSYGNEFSKCMASTVNGTVALGNAPCILFSNAIQHLIALSDTIFKPFCDRPTQNFASICPLEARSCPKRRR